MSTDTVALAKAAQPRRRAKVTMNTNIDTFDNSMKIKYLVAQAPARKK